MAISFCCAHCGKPGFKPTSHANRSAKRTAPLFCDRICFGLSRRLDRSDAENRALKAAYDEQYRERNRETIKARKATAYRANPPREREQSYRKANMPHHVEYCRRPEYRKWKAQYDRKYRAQKDFGPFAEAALLINDLQTEILSRASRYEIDLANGKLNKKLRRRREYETLCG